MDDDDALDDPFAEDAYLRTIHVRILQELGIFPGPGLAYMGPLDFLFLRTVPPCVATRGDMPAQAVRSERERLWNPPAGARLESQQGLDNIVISANQELRRLIAARRSFSFA